MEPYAVVAAGCRQRGPFRRAVGRGRPDNLLERRQHQRHSAGRFLVGELSALQPGPRLHFKFDVGAGSLVLGGFIFGCAVVATGDLV